MVCSLEYVLVCTQVKKEGEGFHLFFFNISSTNFIFIYSLHYSISVNF